jgi:hypothetical protein
MTSAGNEEGSRPAGSGDPEAESRGRSRVAIGAIAAVLLLLLLPVLAGRVYVSDDLGSAYLPLRIEYAHRLLRGESVAWSPALLGGYYVLGDAIVGPCQPVTDLVYRFLPLNVAFAIETLAHYPLAIAGAFLLLRRWGLPADAALFGAATLAFGGYFLIRFCHAPFLNIAAHLPWLLWAEDILFRDGSPRRVRWAWLAIVLLTGSQWLIGGTPIPYMSAQVEALYVLALAFRGLVRRGPLAAWVLAKVLGGLVGCAQILPTLEAALQSRRLNSDIEAILRGSLHPLDLLQLFSPYWFTGRAYAYQELPVSLELSLYCGSVATILAAWALIRRRRLGPLGGWVGVAAAIAVVGLLFAMGRYGGLFVLQCYLPLVGKFRIPGRYLLFAQVGLAALAAIGLADLGRARSDERREPRGLWLLLLVPLAQMAWLGAGFVRNGFHPPERFAWRALSIAIFLTAFLLVCASSRRIRYAFPLLIAFALADQTFYFVSLYGRYLVVKQDPVSSAEHSPVLVATELRPLMTLQEYTDLVPPCPARDHERVVGVDRDMSLVRDLYSIEGYVGFVPRRALDYRRPAARRVAGVRWELSGLGAGAEWHELPGALPYARLVARAVASEDPARAIEEIDPATTAVVAAPLDFPPGDVGTAVLEEDHPGDIRITTTAPARRLLVVAENDHPGWWATVDGQRQTPIRVYGDFLGLVVPEGRHRVEFVFRPWSLRLGPWISLGGLGLALALFAGSFLVRGRQSAAT